MIKIMTTSFKTGNCERGTSEAISFQIGIAALRSQSPVNEMRLSICYCCHQQTIG